MSLFLHSALLPDFVSFMKRKATANPIKNCWTFCFRQLGGTGICPCPPLIFNNFYVCMDPCSLMENSSPCSNSQHPSACTTCPGGSSRRPELPNNPCREWDALATNIFVPIAGRVNDGRPFSLAFCLGPVASLPRPTQPQCWKWACCGWLWYIAVGGCGVSQERWALRALGTVGPDGHCWALFSSLKSAQWWHTAAETPFLQALGM